MKNVFIIPVFLFFSLLLNPVFGQKPDNPAQFEKEISAFEISDSINMPAPGGIVIVGSSSVRGWRTLPQEVPDLNIIMRGFGGSRLGDATYYFDRVVKKYQPKKVVLYSGDNDVASGKNAAQTYEQFELFAKKMEQELPNAELIYISIKPSPKRWNLWLTMRTVNKRIERYASKHPQVTYLDVATPMLGEDGEPIPKLFQRDGVHMTPAGYEIWGEVVKPYLRK